MHGSARKPRAGAAGAFVREFLRDPGATAAIAPSSRRLARQMLDGIDMGSLNSIVEFGPGSGVFTREVLGRLPGDWHMDLTREARVCGRPTFIAIEYNPRMAEIVREQFPGAVVVTESAANIERVCADHGVTPGTLDCVISGLGWASFPPALTTQILEATARVLRPGGHFRTFAYHIGLVKRSAWHLKSELRRLFSSVESSPGVWANLPPAFVYRCVK